MEKNKSTGSASSSYNQKINQSIDDITIKNSIKAKLAKQNMFTLVGVKVSDGRVLLNGKVPTILDKVEVYKIVWLQPGVKEVNDEIIVTKNTGTNVKGLASDSAITSEIKSKLLITKNIKSTNYSFETIDGVVYIIGSTNSKTELNKVLNIVNDVKGVKKVVNYIKVQ